MIQWGALSGTTKETLKLVVLYDAFHASFCPFWPTWLGYGALLTNIYCMTQ
jgi:hypothetical protein